MSSSADKRSTFPFHSGCDEITRSIDRSDQATHDDRSAVTEPDNRPRSGRDDVPDLRVVPVDHTSIACGELVDMGAEPVGVERRPSPQPVDRVEFEMRKPE